MAFTLDRSRALYDRARETLVEGVSSPSRGAVNYDVPIFMASGAGGRITDADGNEYVDLMMAYGALLHGHAHPRLVAAGERALRQGTLFATASEIEVQVAERISALVPGAERVRFANTGTEATMAAIRIARALTGRPLVVKFEGHYHGWYDAFLVSSHPRDPGTLGDPADPPRVLDSEGLTDGSVADTVVCAWNDAELLADCLARHEGRVAAVITEPVMANMGVIPPRPGYLDEMRRLCDEHGAMLIVDETVTGFRLHPGGCQALYGVTGDLATFGKALGAGLPLAAITGPAGINSFRTGSILRFSPSSECAPSSVISPVSAKTTRSAGAPSTRPGWAPGSRSPPSPDRPASWTSSPAAACCTTGPRTHPTSPSR